MPRPPSRGNPWRAEREESSREGTTASALPAPPGEKAADAQAQPQPELQPRLAVWLRSSPLCASVSPCEGPARDERCSELNRVPQTPEAEPRPPGPRNGPVSADGAFEG